MPTRQDIYRKLGLAAAVATLLWPIGLACYCADGIRDAWNHHQSDIPTHAGFVIAVLCVVLSLSVQGIAVYRLSRRLDGAEKFAAKVAVFHGGVALAILGLTSFGPPMSQSNVTSVWFLAWLCPFNMQEWVPNPFPFLVLLQWAFCAAALGSSKEVIWRGVAIASLCFNGLLGVWTFSPAMGPSWRSFDDPITVFFGVGVCIHCLAIVLIAFRRPSAWIWAGIVGFGCLISGFILSLGFDGPLFGFGTGSNGSTPPPTTASEIGAILHIGWYSLGAMIPPIAYALIACASVVFFRSRVLRPTGAPPRPSSDAERITLNSPTYLHVRVTETTPSSTPKALVITHIFKNRLTP